MKIQNNQLCTMWTNRTRKKNKRHANLSFNGNQINETCLEGASLSFVSHIKKISQQYCKNNRSISEVSCLPNLFKQCCCGIFNLL